MEAVKPIWSDVWSEKHQGWHTPIGFVSKATAEFFTRSYAPMTVVDNGDGTCTLEVRKVKP